MRVKNEREVAQSSPTLSDPMDCSLPGPWDFPGRSTGVGCHCLLQESCIPLYKRKQVLMIFVVVVVVSSPDLLTSHRPHQ